MLKLTLLIALLACSAALQGCISFGCSEADKASCKDAYCNPGRTGCSVDPPTPGPEPGVVIAPPSCTEAGAKLVVPPPFFTARTRLPNGAPIAAPEVRQCQAFEVIWNVCNAGSVTSTPVTYTVRLKEEFPAGANGLDHTEALQAPALGKCSCIQSTFVSPGLHCNEPAFIPTTTRVTTSLPGTTVEPPQGAFNVVL